MRYKVGKYVSDDSMSDLICDNYTTLLVMSRFGIDLGFKELSIGEVCLHSGVHTDTFLAIVNLLISQDKKNVKIDYSKVSLESLVDYLHNSHGYYLEYRLPSIRKKLEEALQSSDRAISMAIVNYFDEYVAEVNNHMMYEEETLFPYIQTVISKGCTKEYSIDVFSEHHDRVEVKLSELKNILIKYCPAKTTNELSSVLYDIFTCERDLASHNSIEDFLLVPTMREIETNR